MNAIQLEFQLDADFDATACIFNVSKELEEMRKSSEKVRKKLFQEMAELKKRCQEIEKENWALRQKMRQLSGEKDEWSYLQNDQLFDLQSLVSV